MGKVHSSVFSDVEKEFVRVRREVHVDGSPVKLEETAYAYDKGISFGQLQAMRPLPDYPLQLVHVPLLFCLDTNHDGWFCSQELTDFVRWLGLNIRKTITALEFQAEVQALCVLQMYKLWQTHNNAADYFALWVVNILASTHPLVTLPVPQPKTAADVKQKRLSNVPRLSLSELTELGSPITDTPQPVDRRFSTASSSGHSTWKGKLSSLPGGGMMAELPPKDDVTVEKHQKDDNITYLACPEGVDSLHTLLQVAETYGMSVRDFVDYLQGLAEQAGELPLDDPELDAFLPISIVDLIAKEFISEYFSVLFSLGVLQGIIAEKQDDDNQKA